MRVLIARAVPSWPARRKGGKNARAEAPAEAACPKRDAQALRGFSRAALAHRALERDLASAAIQRDVLRRRRSRALNRDAERRALHRYLSVRSHVAAELGGGSVGHHRAGVLLNLERASDGARLTVLGDEPGSGHVRARLVVVTAAGRDGQTNPRRTDHANHGALEHGLTIPDFVTSYSTLTRQRS